MSTIVEVGVSGLKYEGLAYEFIDGLYRRYDELIASKDDRDHAFAHAIQLLSWFSDELLRRARSGFVAYPINNNNPEQKEFYGSIHHDIRNLLGLAGIVGSGLVSLEEANRYAFNRDLVSQVDFLDKGRLSSFLIGFSAVDPIVFVEGNPLVPAGTESGFGCQYQPTGTVFYMRDIKSNTMGHSSTLLI